MTRRDTFTKTIEKGEIPEMPPREGPDYWGGKKDNDYDYRSGATIHGMWAAVYQVWTRYLGQRLGDRKVLEVMAGRGWLAKALSMEGVNIKATDQLGPNWTKTHSHEEGLSLFEIEKLDAAQAVAKYKDWADILICSWPPYEDFDIVEACYHWAGRRMIYIGEDQGGCTACDDFFKVFSTDDDDDLYNILFQWSGIHDHVWMGTVRPLDSWPEYIVAEAELNQVDAWFAHSEVQSPNGEGGTDG